MEYTTVKGYISVDEIEIKTGPFGTQLKACDYRPTGTPVLNVRNLGFSDIRTDKLEYVGQDTKERLSSHLLAPGDIVFGRKGAVERHSYISEDEKGWMQGSDCIRLRVKTETINPRFLSYYFLTKAHQNYMLSACSHGTTMASLNQGILEQVRFPLLPRETQDKIVDILSAIDSKIKTNKKINDNLLSQAQAIFDYSYQVADFQQPFTSLIHVLGGGTPKTGEAEFWNGRIPFFTPKDVGRPYAFKTEKTITEAGLEHCNSRLFPKNTTFVTARGTVGKVSLAGRPMAMNQSCYALASDLIDPILVYFYALRAVNSLKHKASGAVFDAIVTRDFDTETISVISETESSRLLSLITPMMSAIHANAEENLRLASLRDSLLPKLMTGEIDVSAVSI